MSPWLERLGNQFLRVSTLILLLRNNNYIYIYIYILLLLRKDGIGIGRNEIKQLHVLNKKEWRGKEGKRRRKRKEEAKKERMELEGMKLSNYMYQIRKKLIFFSRNQLDYQMFMQDMGLQLVI